MKAISVIFTVLAVLVGLCAISVNAQIPPLSHPQSPARRCSAELVAGNQLALAGLQMGQNA